MCARAGRGAAADVAVQLHVAMKRERERFPPRRAHAPLVVARSEWSGGRHGRCGSAVHGGKTKQGACAERRAIGFERQLHDASLTP